MGGFFNPEGKFMRYGAKLWDMMWLNVLTLICCVPLVTAGPALTAMYYVLLKIFRDEENGVTKLFFKSFGQNFKQGLGIQLLFMLVLYLLGTSMQFFGMEAVDGAQIMYWLVVVVLVMVVCIWMWTLILLSRYTNTTRHLIKTALAICASHPFRTLFMAALLAVPGFVLLFTEKVLVFVLVLGITGPGMVHVLWFDGIFRKLEKAPDEKDKTEDSEESESDEEQ